MLYNITTPFLLLKVSLLLWSTSTIAVKPIFRPHTFAKPHPLSNCNALDQDVLHFQDGWLMFWARLLSVRLDTLSVSHLSMWGSDVLLLSSQSKTSSEGGDIYDLSRYMSLKWCITPNLLEMNNSRTFKSEEISGRGFCSPLSSWMNWRFLCVSKNCERTMHASGNLWGYS